MRENHGQRGYNYDRYAHIFSRGLALHPAYVDGFIEGCLHRIAEDRLDGARSLGEYLLDPEMREHVVTLLRGEREVRAVRPGG